MIIYKLNFCLFVFPELSNVRFHGRYLVGCLLIQIGAHFFNLFQIAVRRIGDRLRFWQRVVRFHDAELHGAQKLVGVVQIHVGVRTRLALDLLVQFVQILIGESHLVVAVDVAQFTQIAHFGQQICIRPIEMLNIQIIDKQTEENRIE